MNLVHTGLPPAFLGTGAEDKLVYPRNTVALASNWRRAGAEAVERHYVGVGHAGTLLALGVFTRHRAPVLADIVAFLRAKIGA